MNETSRISSSRLVHGSRPSTFSSPWYEVRPRIALSAVVLPAPFGPIIPRMRPSSTRKSMPSSATVVPNVLRSPRASMQAMASVLLLFGSPGDFQEFFRAEAESSNCRVNSRPMFGEKFLSFGFHQQTVRTGFDEHAQAAPLLDEFLIYQSLVSLEHSEWIHAVLGCDIPHRWKRVAFFEHAVENHVHNAIAKLAINRLMIIPFTIHSLSQTSLRPQCPSPL